MPGFCRDCFAETGEAQPRCTACGSPRLIRHVQLNALSIAHVDCDAFYATIEKRDNPSLADKPLIIGGGKRGVVSTACYIARTFGVHSAMPMFKARKLCPHATVVKPDMAKYVRVGREVRKLMFDLTPQVEPLSIDEAFLDLSGTERLHGLIPAQVLARFAADVEEKLRITVSIGLSCNKFLAKIASDLDKPRGFAVLGGSEAQAFLADKPVSFIFGVGKVASARLARDGFHRIADRTGDAAQRALRHGASAAGDLHQPALPVARPHGAQEAAGRDRRHRAHRALGRLHMRVGINGMGRIGRLALRAALGGVRRADGDPRAGNRLDVVHLNEVKGGAAATAHLLEFDSTHGRWHAAFGVEDDSAIRIDNRSGSSSGSASATRRARSQLRYAAATSRVAAHVAARMCQP
jgi:hypothetical protein